MPSVNIHIEAASAAELQVQMEQLLRGLPPLQAAGSADPSQTPANTVAAEPEAEAASKPKRPSRSKKTKQPVEAEAEAEDVRAAQAERVERVELKDVQDAVKAVVEAFEGDEGTRQAIAMLDEFGTKTARMAHEAGVGAAVIKRAAEIVAGAS